MPFTPSNGDSFIIGDRKQVGYSLRGTSYSIQPNGWYTAGQNITKGYAVSIGNAAYASAVGSGSAGNVFVTQEGVTEKTVGIALNSAITGGKVETVDRGHYQWPDYYTIAVTGTTSQTITVNGVSYTPASVGVGNTGALIDNIITAYNLNPRPDIYFYKFSSNVLAFYYPDSAPAPTFVYDITNSTATKSTVFATGDIGNTAYITPVSNPALPANQFTTDRNYAVSTGNPPIEVGIVTSLSSVFIDFEGDSRGASNLSQVSAVAGEQIVMTNSIPILVSMGTDGKVYLSDNRKDKNDTTKSRNTPLGFLVGGEGFGSTVTLNTNVVIQKAGVIPGFTGLVPGQPIYASNDGSLNSVGAFTQSDGATSPYTMVTTPVGFAYSETQIYVEIGFNSNFSDTADVGTMIAMKNATPDSGYLKANGATLNIAGLTTGLASPNEGTWDGSALLTKIGTTYGGHIIYTVSGTASNTGLSFFINGVAYTNTGTTANSIATQIGALGVVAGYMFADEGAGQFSITHTGDYAQPTIVFGSLTDISILVTGGTFNLPNITHTPSVQIKTTNWYTFNTVTPLFRIDTEWVNYSSSPIIATTAVGTIGAGLAYFDIPTTAYGQNPQLSDLFAEIYIKDNSGNQKKIAQELFTYTYGGATPSYKTYGFQLSAPDASHIRVEFGKDGLAYYDNTGLASAGTAYTAINSSWSYKVLIYKTERFNKYYDYSMDQWFSQFKSLDLVDYTATTVTPGAGRFDLSSTNPVTTGTKRLNYNGDYWATSINATNNGYFGGSVTSNSNAFKLNSTNVGTINATALSFDRTWTFPDTPGEILVAGATEVSSFFHRGNTTPSGANVARLNYSGNFYTNNVLATTSIYAGANIEATGGIRTLATNVAAGYFTVAQDTSRATASTYSRTTYTGKLVAGHLEANTVTGDMVSAINANGNFDLQNQVGVTPTNWVVYNDSPSTSPVDATGGDSTGVTLLTKNTSSSVSNDSSFYATVTKDGSVRTGYGVSTPFNIPDVRTDRWIQVTFDYKTYGTFNNGDIGVFVVPSGAGAISAINYLVNAAPIGGSFSTFFRATSATSYRLAIHIRSNLASTFSMDIARVAVSIPTTSGLSGSLLVGSVNVPNGINPAYIMDMNQNTSLGYTPTSGSLYFNKTSGGATYFGGLVDVTGATTLNSSLSVTGVTNLGSALNVNNSSATVLSGALTVAGVSTHNGASVFNNILSIVGSYATTLGGTLTVTGTSTHNGTSVFNNTVSTGTDVATNLNGPLTVAVGKTTQLNGDLNVANGYLTTIGNTGLNVNGPTYVNNTFRVGAFLTTLDGNLTVTGTTTHYGATTFNGSLTVAGANTSTFGTGTFTVGGVTNINNTLNAGGNANITGALTVVGNNATTLNGTLTVAGVTNINNALNVNTGTFTVANSNLTSLTGALSVTGVSTLSGVTNINNTLTVASGRATTLNGGLTVGAGYLTSINGGLTVTGGAFTVSGGNTTNLGGALNVTGLSDFSSGVTFRSTVTTTAGVATNLGGALNVANGYLTTFGNGGFSSSSGGTIDSDPLMGANSDSKVPTQKAVKAYIDNTKSFPIGTMIAYDGTTWTNNGTMPGWYVCDGGTYNNYQTPNLTGQCYLAGKTNGTAPGSVFGTNVTTLGISQIPTHSHTMAHNHSGGTSTYNGSHSHDATHTHGVWGSSGVDTPDHSHPSTGYGGGTSYSQAAYGTHFGNTGGASNRHTHSITVGINSYTGSTGVTDLSHSHTFTTGGASNSTTSSEGGNSSFNNYPKTYSVLWIRKCS